MMTAQLPTERPAAKIITEIEFFELLDRMHDRAQRQASQARPRLFSNALREHYVFKTLHSGMVVRLRQTAVEMNFYALAHLSYAPRQLSARLNTPRRAPLLSQTVD
jgi:hypothetical protein